MTEQAQRSGRNRKIAVGAAAALAVVVGGGAYLVGSGGDDTITQDTAIGPMPTVPTEAPTPAPAGTTAGHAPKAAAKRTASPSPVPTSPDAAKVRRQIEAARAKAAKDGHPLQRPLTTPPKPQVAAADAGSYTEESRPLPDGGTLRIMSARYDLSGQREMLWAADSGVQAGAARCTQNFRFAAGQKPAVRKTMLLCFRNTADRSVVVLAAGRTEVPDTTQILNVLDTQWNRL